ncbi:MAG: hypothetical protein QOD14_22 [Solirubrobacterales bacterium]|jgi:hypothetical protein|nr:hypothetical protein [Solirubrobacterales bacterium]
MTGTSRPAHRRLRGAVALLAISAGLVSLSSVSSALASTQIGATFVPVDGYGAGTYLQSVTPAGQYSAPTSGVITSWSYQADSTHALAIKLKVARSAGGNDFTIVGESALKNPVLNVLNTYNVKIPVHAGDFLGLYNDASNGYLSRTTAGYGYHSLLSTDAPPGDTSTYIDSASADTQFDVSAALEPDCDGDGLGDETQDPDTSSCHPPPASAPTGQRAAAKKHCKKKFPKGPKRAKCIKKAKRLPV